MSQQLEKLKTKLKELFQLNEPDLDFGFYRIMHAKSAEVTAFLEEDLLPQVQVAFAAYQSADKAGIQKELDQAIEQARALGADPETLPKVQALRARLANEAVDIAGLEAEVYDHLYNFFRRYYSEGDFLSKRVYKPGVYAIPYEGEEVKLHWANADQYYIKTSEYLRDYAFRLRPDDDANPMRVHFRLVDAAEGEHGNVKEAEGKARLFVLTSGDLLSEEPGLEAAELVVHFEYRPATVDDWPEDQRAGRTKPPVQKDLLAAAEARLLGVADERFRAWIEALGREHVRADGEAAGYSRLRAHLNRYAARNTFDYFIHKDLGGFLRRELDFYIKNELMHLDDIESQDAPRVEQYLSKIKVVRQVAGKIIDFLAQLENFQQKLWLKKKFVVETGYCVTLGFIPEAFYADIVTNEAQCEEWVRLLAIDQLTGDVASAPYTAPLTVQFLKDNPTLPLDTRHFSTAFTNGLLEAIGDIDAGIDGLLIHADNFQALRLLQARLGHRVDCIYIDPPYNTGDSQILYKNGYLSSSWLALMDSRLDVASTLLTSDPVLFIAIDDFEMVDLSKLVDTILPTMNREMIIVNHHPQGGKATTLAHTHEYMLTCVASSSDRTLLGRSDDDGVERRPFKRSGTAESNFRYGRPNSFYAILADPETSAVVGLEPPPTGNDYPTGPTQSGYIRIYPIGGNGEERVWRRSYESCQRLVENGKLVCTEAQTVYQLIEKHERTAALFSNWVDPRYNAGTFGANLLRDIIGAHNPFAYPKSLYTVADAVYAADLHDGNVVLDFFGGSGTTAHAVIHLNRQDDVRRRFILVEAESYFDSVIVPRVKKTVFAPDWKDGKPVRRASSEEGERSPRVVKMLRLESYEDGLNNLDNARSSTQTSLLDSAEAAGDDGLKEKYLLHYMLDVETRGSQSLLNVAAFVDPRAYRLKVKRPGSDESREVNVDLLETFNWLIGLRVRHIAAPQTFSAEFVRDDDPDLPKDAPQRLLLKDGRLKEADDGPWWFRTVTGTDPEGRRTLVIWRTRPGGETSEGVEQDNLVLEAWFTKQGYSSKDSEFDVIYVNGGNNLENLKGPDDTWKVRLLEEDFHRLMFDTEDI